MTKQAGRPTTEVVADRNWGGLPSEMKAKVPALIKQGMSRVANILKDDKASDSNVLRAFKDTIDIYKYMVEQEQKALGEGKGAAPTTTPEEAEDKPLGISLIALTANSK